MANNQDYSSHGGPRKGAGRKAGSLTKKTREIASKAAAEGITPLEFILSVMRNETSEPRDRMAAAIAAAPYIHPRLAAVDVKGDLNVGVVIQATPLDERL